MKRSERMGRGAKEVVDGEKKGTTGKYRQLSEILPEMQMHI
ncbi:MAG: hypothetical protein PV340_05270 [Wolbachia sp.]|nr:hypothetical protein [Wolbachia sp.]MDD9336005.1 hypothetical protein [Wolbachia sp.]